MDHSNKPISNYKKRKIISCFCLDLRARETSKLLGLNRNTINRCFNIFRKAIYSHQLSEKRLFIGEVEIDESYFGPKRIPGKISKKGRGTHKQPVFGIFERNGRAYTEIIPDCSLRILRKIISGKIDLSSTIFSDSWRGYDGLVDVRFDKHSGLTIGKMNSPGIMFMSMVLNLSGLSLNGDLPSLRELRKTSNSILRNVNGDGEKLPNNLKKISTELSEC